MASNKTCPLLLASSNDYTKGTTCRENNCAWWDANTGVCAVLAIARNVETVGNTLEWVGRNRQ